MSDKKQLTKEEQAKKEAERERRRKEREERKARREAEKANEDATPESKEQERERRRKEREQRRKARENNQDKKEDKAKDPEKKKAIVKLVISIVSMVIVAIIILLIHNITYRYVKKPGIFDDTLGKGYSQKVVLEETVNEISIKKEEVKGDKAEGFIYTGSNSNSFDTAGGAVSGTIEIQIVVDNQGKILAYVFSRYEHTETGFKDTVISYLDSLIGTDISNITTHYEEEMAKPNDERIWAGATKTSVDTVYPILEAIKEVASK